MEKIEFLSPWGSAESQTDDTKLTFAKQLALETSPGHTLYKVPVRLLARGNGDDVLFEIMDGSRRVAQVHLVWQGKQQPPWPGTQIYASLEEWCDQSMLPEHKEWIGE